MLGNKLRVLTFTLPLSLSSRSPVFSVPAQASQGCVSVCACVCGGGSNALCETKCSGRMLYDSVISLWVTYTHTRTVSQRGKHTETVVPTHTLIKTMYLSEKRTLSWDTHTGDGGLSPCPCAGQPNYLSAPHCFPSVLSLFVRFAALSFSSFVFFGPCFSPSLHLIDQ